MTTTKYGSRICLKKNWQRYWLKIVIFIVTDKGKLAGGFQCNGIPAPGDTAFEIFKHPGGVNRMLFYAQIRMSEKSNDISSIVPSLEIYNTETIQGAETQTVLSGGDFSVFKTNITPPFMQGN